MQLIFGLCLLINLMLMGVSLWEHNWGVAALTLFWALNAAVSIKRLNAQERMRRRMREVMDDSSTPEASIAG